MEKEFVNPNLHVALVHYPLAMLIVGTLIELLSFMWRRHGFRAAGRWMILLGALASIPVALSGVYALRDVSSPTELIAPWKDVVAESPLTAAQWEMLTEHAILSCVATGLAVLVVVTWLGASDVWRYRLHWPLLVLLLVSVGLIVAAAYHGGEVVYRHGTGVAHSHSTEATTGPSDETHQPESSESANTVRGITETVEYFVPPMQAHVIFAGCAVALAMAALGLSIRRITQAAPPTNVDHIAAALGPPSAIIGDEPPERPEPADVLAVPVPAARFWLLACLAAALTAGGGYYLLARGFGIWYVPELWKAAIVGNARRMAHVIAGGAIVVLPLVLAMLARWAPRQKWLLIPAALLLVLAVAFQVWVGVLLLFDSPQGPVNRFN